MGKVNLSLTLNCEACSDEEIEALHKAMNAGRDAIVQAAEQNGTKIVVQKTLVESSETTPGKVAAEPESEKMILQQLLLDADEVARRRWNKGLCDAFEIGGQAYQSQTCTKVLEDLKRQGRKAKISLSDFK